MKRVMILAPHQDDELILCGSFLKELVQQNDVYIVFTTNGDYEEKIGKVRLKESLEVSRLFGIDEEHIIFLGYANEYDCNYPHIYNAASGETVFSQYGNDRTYGLKNHPEYCCARTGKHHLYTRRNILFDLTNVIQELMPDVIFATDLEIHPDHKANSLLLDEAMGKIIKKNYGYKPIILKKPGYTTAWSGDKDYSKINNRQTKLLVTDVRTNGHRSVFNNPYLKWDHRIRLPIGKSVRNKKEDNILYKALLLYQSQEAHVHFENMLNSDVVFWQRRTDSLTYSAQIQVSSGRKEFLNDFKIADSTDIRRKSIDSWQADASVWRPDENDRMPRIDIIFDKQEYVSEVVIYQEYYPVSQIIRSRLLFDDSMEINVQNVRIDGRTKVFFPPVRARKISYIIDEVSNGNGQPGITEIEVYAAQRPCLMFCKIMFHNNFVYEYYVEGDNLSIPIEIYEYWNDGTSKKVTNLNDYKVKIIAQKDDKPDIEIVNNRITGTVKKSVAVRIERKDNDEITDEVVIICKNQNKKPKFNIIKPESGIYYGKTADFLARLSYGDPRRGMDYFVKEYIRGILLENNSYVSHDRKIFILGVPDHYNLGDQAIIYATRKFLTKLYPQIEIEEVPIMNFARKLPYLKNNIQRNDLIILQGGGNMGNIYWRNERIRREVISHFPENVKIIFPETIYYEASSEGKRDFELSKKLYNSRSIIIFARERKSYEIMKKAYPGCRVYLVPDIVCFLSPYPIDQMRDGIGLYFRNDMESSIRGAEKNEIEAFFDAQSERYRYADMIYRSQGYIGIVNRNQIVNKKINEIASFKMIVTDRLHAMIICSITGTPCIVIARYNHKIRSFYRTWFENSPYICLVDSMEEFTQAYYRMKAIGGQEPIQLDFDKMKKILEEWK